MNKFVAWTCVFLLILIHWIDMTLTSYYIGDDANREAFPPMAWAIATFGVHTACWISRAIMFMFFWIALMNYKKRPWFYFLILVTALYYTAMSPWLFQLQIISWPLPSETIVF